MVCAYNAMCQAYTSLKNKYIIGLETKPAITFPMTDILIHLKFVRQVLAVF
jgi:hypothetical protein